MSVTREHSDETMCVMDGDTNRGMKGRLILLLLQMDQHGSVQQDEEVGFARFLRRLHREMVTRIENHGSIQDRDG